MNRLPDFFIIGSMKSGTSTLYTDLQKHPRIFLPNLKEPGYFVGPDFENNSSDTLLVGLETYKRLYMPAPDNSLLGDASTHYTKLPEFPDAPARIKNSCGSETKFIYLMREPLARSVSHYKHEILKGRITQPIDQAILEYSPLISYSKYHYQIEPWLETFDESKFLFLKFENYIKDRVNTVKRIFEFLELDDEGITNTPDFDTIANSSLTQPRLPKFLERIKNSELYFSTVQPLIKKNVRTWISRYLVPRKSPPINTDMSKHSLDYYWSKISSEDLVFYNNST